MDRWRLAVIFLIVLVVSGGIFRTSATREELSWFEQAAYEVVAPLQRWVSAPVRAVGGWFGNLTELRGAALENERLRAEIAALRVEQSALQQAHRENAELRRILRVAQEAVDQVTVAEVIARSPSNWLGSITINKGRHHGVEPNMAVVAPEGVVGRVRTVTARSAEVILVTDVRSAIGGRIAERDHGVLVEGTSDPRGNLARVRLLVWEGDLQPGDVVVTSGLSRIFPKGLPIGTIQSVEKRDSGLTPIGYLEPFVDLERLDWVVLLALEDVDAPWWDLP